MKFVHLMNSFLALVLSMEKVTTVGALSLDKSPSGSLIAARDSSVSTTWADLARPGRTSPNTSLLERQWQCYDQGYGRCPGTNHCCPIGGRCCNNGTCCRSGYYCVTGGCCLIGKVCSGPGRRCARADSYPCPNANVCCPYGTTCGRNASGEPVCRDTTYELTTSTSRTTIIVRATSTTSSSSTSSKTARPNTEEPDIETDIETDFDTPTDAPTPTASDPLTIPSQSANNGTTTTTSLRASKPSIAAFTSTPTFSSGISTANEATRGRTVGVTIGLAIIAGALMI